MNDLVDSTPLVLILGTALNDTEALQDVNDVVDAATLHSQLFSALV